MLHCPEHTQEVRTPHYITSPVLYFNHLYSFTSHSITVHYPGPYFLHITLNALHCITSHHIALPSCRNSVRRMCGTARRRKQFLLHRHLLLFHHLPLFLLLFFFLLPLVPILLLSFFFFWPTVVDTLNKSIVRRPELIRQPSIIHPCFTSSSSRSSTMFACCRLRSLVAANGANASSLLDIGVNNSLEGKRSIIDSSLRYKF